MKTTIKITVIIFLMVMPLIGKSQFKVSIGAEIASAQGDLNDAVNFGFGVSGGVEIGLGNKTGLTAQAGYIYFLTKENYAAAHLSPYLLGIKMYLKEKEEGAFIHTQIGLHSLSITTADSQYLGITSKGYTRSSTDLSYGIGIGYVINNHADICMRYQLITNDGNSSNYIGVRVAYNF
jgi:hypothetical protein